MNDKNMGFTLPDSYASPLFVEENENNLKMMLESLGKDLRLFSDFPNNTRVVSAEQIGKCFSQQSYDLLKGIFLYIKAASSGENKNGGKI